MVFEDKDLGIIKTRYNSRAKNIIARYNNDHYIITLPYNFNSKDLPKVIEEMKPKLQKLKKQKIIKPITDGTTINTFSKPIVVKISNLTDNINIVTGENEISILVNPKIDINKSNIQTNLIYNINRILYFEAHNILIPLTHKFAKELNLSIREVKISKSKGRWGSCSSKKVINLSYYLMLLPKELVEYVILHELAHTIEMNHSKDFWSLLDKMCGTNSKVLGGITRKYSSNDLELVRSM